MGAGSQNQPTSSTGCYHGEQATAGWYLTNVLDPLRGSGVEPFFLVFYRTKTTDQVIRDYFDVWRARAYKAGFYRFSGNRPEGMLNGAKAEKPKFDAAGYLERPRRG